LYSEYHGAFNFKPAPSAFAGGVKISASRHSRIMPSSTLLWRVRLAAADAMARVKVHVSGTRTLCVAGAHTTLDNAHQFVMLVTWTQTDIADFPP
jgi:hypothetical protein